MIGLLNVADVLEKARDLWVAHPTKGWHARDANGVNVPACDPRAVCWCAVGAIRKICGPDAHLLQ